MRYRMTQRLWSLADRFVIQNASGEDVGYVEGKVFSWGRQLSFLDVRGHEVAYIKRVVMTMVPMYEIYRDGHLCAVVNEKVFTLKPWFTVDVPGPDDLTIEGDFMAHEYFFVRGGKTVATVSKQWWTLADTYGVEVLDDEDHILILACTVVVDVVAEDHRSK